MGDLSGIPRQIYRERINYYLEKTNLSEQRRKKMKQLSGGMKRRVGLIQALLNEPEFLIVDEQPKNPLWDFQICMIDCCYIISECYC